MAAVEVVEAAAVTVVWVSVCAAAVDAECEVDGWLRRPSRARLPAEGDMQHNSGSKQRRVGCDSGQTTARGDSGRDDKRAEAKE